MDGDSVEASVELTVTGDVTSVGQTRGHSVVVLLFVEDSVVVEDDAKRKIDRGIVNEHFSNMYYKK